MAAFKHSTWALNRFALPALCAAMISGLPISDVLGQDGAAKIYSTPVRSDVLIVQGRKEAAEAVKGQLVKGQLKVLDPPAQTVNYKVTIAVSGEGTDTRILDELELSALDNNKAKLQFGQQVAVPIGATQMSSGRIVRSHSRQDAGTVVQIQPRVMNGKILTQISLEKSWIEAPMSKSDDDVNSQHTTFNVSFDSTVALHDGVAQTIKVKAASSPGGQRSVLITIAASTKPGAKGKTAGRASVPAVRDTPARAMPSPTFGGGRSSRPPYSRITRPVPSGAQNATGDAGIASRERTARIAETALLNAEVQKQADRIAKLFAELKGLEDREQKHQRQLASAKEKEEQQLAENARLKELLRVQKIGPRTAFVRTLPEKKNNAQTLFSRIDSNNDQAISQAEWDALSISKVFVDRGFKYSAGMNQKQFEVSMSNMLKSLRRRTDSDKEASQSPRGKSDAGSDDAKEKTKDRGDKGGEKEGEKDRKKGSRKSDKK